MIKKLILVLLYFIIILSYNKEILASGIDDSSNLFRQINSINSLNDQIINQQLQQINLLANQNSFNYLKKNTLVNKSKFNDLKIANDIDFTNLIKDDNILKNNQKKSLNCRYLKEIEFINNSQISEFNFKTISQNQFIFKCVDKELIIKIIEHYQQLLNQAGLITSKISFNFFDANKGILSLSVNYGMIEKIIINKNNFFDKIQKYTAFGSQENQVLNINKLNQGLIQINRLQINDAKLKIKASSKNLYSDVIVENNRKFPLIVKLNYDNLGNDFTGYNRSGLDLNFQNILHLNDQITINYVTNLEDPHNQKGFKSIASSINIPWHYNNFSYDYSLTKFQNTSRGQVIPITFSGFFKRQAFGFQRSIYHKANYRIGLSNSLVIKESTSYINQQKIITSERRLSILNLAINFDINFKNDYHLFLKPSWNKGVKIFDAQKDSPNIDQRNPHAQFEYYKIYLNFSKKFINQNKHNLLWYNSEIDLQKSRIALYGMEQISIGGYYSVRGFKDFSISADSGYFWRNKINLNLGDFKNYHSQIKFPKSLNFLNKISLETFFDYGYVRNNYSFGKADGRLSGAGFKLIFNSKNFNCSLTNSYALNHSSLLNSKSKNLKSLNFELSINF